MNSGTVSKIRAEIDHAFTKIAENQQLIKASELGFRASYLRELQESKDLNSFTEKLYAEVLYLRNLVLHAEIAFLKSALAKEYETQKVKRGRPHARKLGIRLEKSDQEVGRHKLGAPTTLPWPLEDRPPLIAAGNKLLEEFPNMSGVRAAEAVVQKYGVTSKEDIDRLTSDLKKRIKKAKTPK